MFREFNVQLDDVELIGGGDSLLEGTNVTKVVVGGDSKLSSLDSTFKDCVELFRVDGELDLDGVNSIDSILEGTELVTDLEVKNANNDNLTSNNAFPYIESITIGGECTKGGIQQVLKGATWQLDGISYTGEAEDRVSLKTVEGTDNVSISDALEQKARTLEITGQTYDNLIESGVEYKLTDTYSATWTEGTEYIENMPSKIEIPEIWGNTIQAESDLSNIQSVGDLYVDKEGNPILDEEGNEQYKLEVMTSNGNLVNLRNRTVSDINKFEINTPNKFTVTAKLQGAWDRQHVKVKVPVKANRTYVVGAKFDSFAFESKSTRLGVKLGSLAENFIGSGSFRRYQIGDTDTNMIITYYPMYGKLADYNIDPITASVSLYVEEAYDIEFIEREESIQTILLPQPLKQLGTIKYYIQGLGDRYDKQYDKLYYDYNSKCYKLDKLKTKTIKASYFANNVSGRVEVKVQTNSLGEEFVTISMGTYNNPILGITPWNTIGIFNVDSIMCNCKNDLGIPVSTGRAIMNKGVHEGALIGFNASISNFWSITIMVKKEKYGDRSLDLDGVRDFFNTYEFEFEYLYDLNSFDSMYETIETKILEPIALDTYSPKTYISTNTEIQPTQMSIVNKETKITPKFLDPNKNYTIKFNCNEKGDTPVKVNLGGTETDIDATLGENTIEITTPEIIDNKSLVLSGEGNILTDVFVIADNMSTGDLQEDGTYKINVNITNTTDAYDISIIATKPLGTDEKLYWNKSNKRYEIDRKGEIEVPTAIGDNIDLPRLCQGGVTNISISSGNIKPDKLQIEHNDFE